MPSFQYLVFRDFKKDYIPEILDEIYTKKVYEPFVLGRKNLIVADFGANQGLATYYFAPYAKTIYAVEPAQQHIETLKEMVKLNKLENKVVLCQYAISNENTKTRFYHSPNPTAFMLNEGVLPSQDDFEEVEVITIEEFFKRNKIDSIDILKLDIEGQEAKLISSKEFEKYAPKIVTILGEYHDWCGISKGAFMNTLRDLGYHFEWRSDTKAAVFQAQRI